ncbi:MAG: hypothetical protein KBD78_15665 [Oligoflexales bacterium]|nr:hypothetical protein [Oligoflexales bacterium]
MKNRILFLVLSFLYCSTSGAASIKILNQDEYKYSLVSSVELKTSDDEIFGKTAILKIRGEFRLDTYDFTGTKTSTTLQSSQEPDSPALNLYFYPSSLKQLNDCLLAANEAYLKETVKLMVHISYLPNTDAPASIRCIAKKKIIEY